MHFLYSLEHMLPILEIIRVGLIVHLQVHTK